MDTTRHRLSSIPRTSLNPRSIFCVGKNYHEHALEMHAMEGGAGEASAENEAEPIIFMKPGTALAKDGLILMPEMDGRPLSSAMHYEAEVVLLVGRDTDGCTPEQASRHVSAVGAGLDMTLRDVQLEAKRAGNPWLKSKGFRRSAFVSDLYPLEDALPSADWTISLTLDGKRVQHAAVGEMIHPPARLVSYLSYLYGLRKGDLIFTGTPAGVGPVSPGDTLRASLSMPEGDGTVKELALLEARVETPLITI